MLVRDAAVRTWCCQGGYVCILYIYIYTYIHICRKNTLRIFINLLYARVVSMSGLSWKAPCRTLPLAQGLEIFEVKHGFLDTKGVLLSESVASNFKIAMIDQALNTPGLTCSRFCNGRMPFPVGWHCNGLGRIDFATLTIPYRSQDHAETRDSKTPDGHLQSDRCTTCFLNPTYPGFCSVLNPISVNAKVHSATTLI